MAFLNLFFICLLSATILPFSSEAVLVYMLYHGFDPFYCLLVATIGNTVGGAMNYFLGRLGDPKWLKRLGTNETKLVHFESKIKKNGFWLALFSWVPIIGDPLVLALGFFRAQAFPVLLLMTLGKFFRYLILSWPFL